MAHIGAAGDNDSKLIELSLAGDADAFAALVNQHQLMVRTVAFRMTGSMSDAEELAQEAFIRAFRQLASFGGEARFSTWLCKIAINLSLDWKRREKRRAEIYSQWSVETAAQTNAGDAFPDELSRRVQAALDKLPAKQRAAVVLTVYHNQSHAEAAKALGCSETTVSWRIFAARRKLKRLLKSATHE